MSTGSKALFILQLQSLLSLCSLSALSLLSLSALSASLSALSVMNHVSEQQHALSEAISFHSSFVFPQCTESGQKLAPEPKLKSGV